MNPKTKTKHASEYAQKLYNLLSESEALEDADRGFWLSAYHSLPEAEQKKLLHMVESGDKELRKEQEAHMNKVAEINAKCAAEMNALRDQNKKILASIKGDDDNPEDFDVDEIMQELHQNGEM